MKGLGYNCGEKFTPGHCCKLIFACYVDVSDTEETDASVEVSLHALIGIRSANAMQILVDVAGTHLIAFVDSGSTHNFISEEVASCARVPVTKRARNVSVVIWL